MAKSKAGRPKGSMNKPAKTIFSIQMLTSPDYEALKDYAEEQQRSVSQSAAILIYKGLFPDED
jgi:hypothetical protein